MSCSQCLQGRSHSAILYPPRWLIIHSALCEHHLIKLIPIWRSELLRELQQIPIVQATNMLLTSLPNTANADTSENSQDMAVAAWQAPEMRMFAETQLAVINNACLQMHSVAL